MAPIPAPDVVVTDGGSGFAKAVRETWPRTRVQRCTFHAFSQVKRYRSYTFTPPPHRCSSMDSSICSVGLSRTSSTSSL